MTATGSEKLALRAFSLGRISNDSLIAVRWAAEPRPRTLAQVLKIAHDQERERKGSEVVLVRKVPAFCCGRTHTSLDQNGSQ